MPTPNDFGPAVEAKDVTLIRNALVKRVIYAIADDEDPTDYVANTAGQVNLGLAYGGIVFWLDPDDTTSAHDGVTVIVTSDGYRYLKSDFQTPRSVLAVNAATPPGNPALGDAYLTSAAPTGDWANNPEQIAVWTVREWVFIEPQVGELVYVADGSTRWVYLDENGAITERFGNQQDTIPDLAPIGGQRRYIVESQTVNDPPGSPNLGVYWIVGPVPTGAWAGETGNIATSYDGGITWTIIPAIEGLEAFDRTQGANFIYRVGTGWVSAAGAWTQIGFVKTDGTGDTTAVDGTPYVFSDTVAPATSNIARADDRSLVFQASRPGALLRVTYRAAMPPGSTNPATAYTWTYALFRDSEATAVDWQVGPYKVENTIVSTHGGFVVFTVTAPDTASHVYHVRIVVNPNASLRPPALGRRIFMIEEAA